MYSYSYESAAVSFGLWVILIFILGIIMIIVGKVLLGVAVYQNARGYCNPNPGMWCVLTILFGFIPAIIYLCTRSSARDRLMVCPQCGTPHPVGMASCPQCGVHNVYSEPYYSPYAQQAVASSKKFLIAALVLIGAAVVGWIIGFFVLMQCAIPVLEGYHYSHGYSHHYW